MVGVQNQDIVQMTNSELTACECVFGVCKICVAIEADTAFVRNGVTIKATVVFAIS